MADRKFLRTKRWVEPPIWIFATPKWCSGSTVSGRTSNSATVRFVIVQFKRLHCEETVFVTVLTLRLTVKGSGSSLCTFFCIITHWIYDFLHLHRLKPVGFLMASSVFNFFKMAKLKNVPYSPSAEILRIHCTNGKNPVKPDSCCFSFCCRFSCPFCNFSVIALGHEFTVRDALLCIDPDSMHVNFYITSRSLTHKKKPPTCWTRFFHLPNCKITPSYIIYG